MNVDETSVVLARLAAALRVNPPMTEELFLAWQDHLRDVKFIDAAEAVEQTVKTATFMPAISEFRAQCKRNAHHRQLRENRELLARQLEEPRVEVDRVKEHLAKMHQDIAAGRERAEEQRRERVRATAEARTAMSAKSPTTQMGVQQ